MNFRKSIAPILVLAVLLVTPTLAAGAGPQRWQDWNASASTASGTSVFLQSQGFPGMEEYYVSAWYGGCSGDRISGGTYKYTGSAAAGIAFSVALSAFCTDTGMIETLTFDVNLNPGLVFHSRSQQDLVKNNIGAEGVPDKVKTEDWNSYGGSGSITTCRGSQCQTEAVTSGYYSVHDAMQ